MDALNSLPSAQQSNVQLLETEQAISGMAYSLRVGLSETSEAPGWVVGLADMPWVPVAALQGVKQAMENGASLAAPFYQGQRGHPAGFAKHWFSALMSLEGDKGARVILQQSSNELQCLECDSAGVLRDIDTPADMTKGSTGA